jgi:hypothetical protein
VSNDGYPASLELRKICRIVPDQLAATRHFVPIAVPQAAQYAFAQAFLF